VLTRVAWFTGTVNLERRRVTDVDALTDFLRAVSSDAAHVAGGRTPLPENDVSAIESSVTGTAPVLVKV